MLYDLYGVPVRISNNQIFETPFPPYVFGALHYASQRAGPPIYRIYSRGNLMKLPQTSSRFNVLQSLG